MSIDEKPTLSRTTITSGRILTTFTSGIILAKFYGIESETITILGITMQAADLSSPAVLIICFMCFGHVTNWYSDYFYIHVWNGGEISPTANNDSKLGSLLREIEVIVESAKRQQEEEGVDKKSTKLLRRAENLREDFKNFEKDINRMSKRVKFMLYGWHGAMPLVLAAVAYFMLLLDIP